MNCQTCKFYKRNFWGKKYCRKDGWNQKESDARNGYTDTLLLRFGLRKTDTGKCKHNKYRKIKVFDIIANENLHVQIYKHGKLIYCRTNRVLLRLRQLTFFKIF